MYVYTCILHVYAYNWAVYIGPMYAYTYSSSETLIYILLLLFLYFIYNIYLYFFFSFSAFESLFVFTYPQHVRLRFFLSINL